MQIINVSGANLALETASNDPEERQRVVLDHENLFNIRVPERTGDFTITYRGEKVMLRAAARIVTGPEPKPGVVYVVNQDLFGLCPDRADFYIPATEFNTMAHRGEQIPVYKHLVGH